MNGVDVAKDRWWSLRSGQAGNPFTPLPMPLLGAFACLAVTYLLVVQVVKTWFYRKHALL
jgi:hypothetical protein